MPAEIADSNSHNTIDSPEIFFNRAVFLATLSYDPGAFNAVISNFKKSFPGRAAILKKHIDDADYEQIIFAAHAIKGMCANIEAKKIAACAGLIEETARQHGDQGTIRHLHAELLALYDLTEPLLYFE